MAIPRFCTNSQQAKQPFQTKVIHSVPFWESGCEKSHPTQSLLSVGKKIRPEVLIQSKSPFPTAHPLESKAAGFCSQPVFRHIQGQEGALWAPYPRPLFIFTSEAKPSCSSLPVLALRCCHGTGMQGRGPSLAEGTGSYFREYGPCPL